MKSSEAMILAVMNAIAPDLSFEYLPRRLRSQKIHLFCSLIPLRGSNQLSYESTDAGSWSFVGSNVPVRNESTMK